MSIDEKCCCVKEPIGTIPIGRIIDKLDVLFGHNEMEKAGELLRYWEAEARAPDCSGTEPGPKRPPLRLRAEGLTLRKM